MTEAQVRLLCSIAAAVSKSENDVNNTFLKSYYLMRCKDITRGHGLPDKQFSSITRCPNCCMEWKNNTEIKVRPIKLSKRQKQRLKSKRITESQKKAVKCRHNLLTSNEIVQICSFCRKSSVNVALKPQKLLSRPAQTNVVTKVTIKEIKNTKTDIKKPEVAKKAKRSETNVYSNALDVFSMQNKNNTLANTIKEKPKVINNNKKKKDKFAGLCQKAVLASAKLKQEKKKSNTLDLFLKPSSNT